MKICPNCQTAFADRSLRFCLQCGGVLANQSGAAESNSKIIWAILSGFALLALTVGGLGAVYFSRQNARVRIDSNEETTQNADQTIEDAASNNSNRAQTAAVEQLDNQNKLISQRNSGGANNAKSVGAAPTTSSASSVRQPDGSNFYFPSFAFDKNPATAWCEGANGAGAGAWLQFDFGREVRLKEIKIMPGYFKDQNVWRKNNRVAAIAVQYSGGATTSNFRFADKMETQTINAGNVLTSSVRIVVDEVYAGSTDADDTLISEVSFVTEP